MIIMQVQFSWIKTTFTQMRNIIMDTVKVVGNLMRSNNLTHWGRVTHICVSKLTIIGSDNGLSPGRHQAIIWTNAGMLLIGPLRANFNETSIEIHTFSLKKIYLKLSSAKWRPFCPGLNVLIHISWSNCRTLISAIRLVFCSTTRYWYITI